MLCVYNVLCKSDAKVAKTLLISKKSSENVTIELLHTDLDIIILLISKFLQTLQRFAGDIGAL